MLSCAVVMVDCLMISLWQEFLFQIGMFTFVLCIRCYEVYKVRLYFLSYVIAIVKI